jgi:IclR family pca regulon transcriptional regulator
LTSNLVSTVVQPACERICANLEGSCSVSVLDGADAVMIARAVPHRLISIGAGIGYRVPALTSSLGRVLLAHLDPGELAAWRAGTRLGDQPGLSDDLRKVRADGYCHVVNDVEAGFQSIAIPLRRWDGTVVAAMNLGCSVERFTPDAMRGEVLDALRATAEELRGQLV